MTLKQIIEQSDTRAGRAFDLVVEAFIVLSLVGFSIETLPDLSAQARWWLNAFEVLAVGVFTVEYALRLFVADRRWGFVFSFYGLVDLAAILPFYLTAELDLRAVRVLRLLRLFRALKLLRYTRAIDRLRRALADIREELVLYLAATAMMVYLASVGIYYFESEVQPEQFGSVFHCLWWSVVTLTTVGYGDVCPVTVGGKAFTSLVLLLGVGVVAVPAGLFASALTKARSEEQGGDGE